MVSDKTRRDAFIEQNLGLVHACAGRFRGRGIEYDDLYSAGCMGLVKACDNFDESRGVCFSTYAVPVILGEIKKLFRDSVKHLFQTDTFCQCFFRGFYWNIHLPVLFFIFRGQAHGGNARYWCSCAADF